MLTVAYLANQLPSAVEPYVSDEIRELRGRRIQIIAGSIRRPVKQEAGSAIEPDIVLRSVSAVTLLRAFCLCWTRWKQISDLIWRVLCGGREGPVQRGKALVHTILGACYAVLLNDRRVDHIHVHHGYFGAWVAMVAARLLNVHFSITLHGSDLLLHKTYMDVKLENCSFCFTVSQFNREYILKHYPEIAAEKVLVSRLGVDVNGHVTRQPFRSEADRRHMRMLAVGRLHAVKDHGFLVCACADLRAEGIAFDCAIAGEGPERRRLESLIQTYELEESVRLLGHVLRERMDALYENVDVVLLTSRSEGIPLVLMEAMSKGTIVLAPAITGIPELVIDGKNGFLYQSGSMSDFLERLLEIHSLVTHSPRRPASRFNLGAGHLDWIRHAARTQIQHNFNRKENLGAFGDAFIARIVSAPTSLPHANFILQQI